MRIGIDAHFLSKISQGTGTYTFQLINALVECISSDADKLILLNKENILHRWSDKPSLEWGKLLSNYTPFNICGGYNYCCFSNNLDVIHTNYLGSLLPTKAKKVVTVHDILFKTHSEYFPKKLQFGVDLFTKQSLKQADKIIAVSHYTKEQLAKYYPFVTDKIEVIYEAPSQDFHVLSPDIVDAQRQKLGLYKPFILFVGRFAPMKNIEPLVEFYLENKHVQNEYDLILVGGFDKSFPNRKLEEKIAATPQIRVLHNISNDDLNVLYNSASLFYFVSNGEGFGLPILEAMSAGCPVITSNTTACNEVAADAALKVNPSSKDEIYNTLEYILSNYQLRQTMSQQGLQRAAQFSWRKCAEQTYNVYKSLV